MRTHIVIDDELVAEAMKLCRIRTKREVVDVALRALVAERRRKDRFDLRGKVRFRDGYDPAATRTR